MKYVLTFVAFVFFAGPASAQVFPPEQQLPQPQFVHPILIEPPNSAAAMLMHDLAHERLIRIVEPALHPLRRMQGNGDDWREFTTSCHTSGQPTELGQAWIRCEGSPPIVRPFEDRRGIFTPELIYGDRTISVIAKGFATHDKLCGNDFDSGDFRDFCDPGKKGRVQAVVIARFTMVTKVLRYTRAEAQSVNAEEKKFSPRNTKPKLVRAGDIKGHEVTVGPVAYEFSDDTLVDIAR